MDTFYFDNAATTCLRDSVVKKMTKSMRQCYGNASSTHAIGRQAKSAIENARKTIAKLLNASPGEIIFTSGGTEGNNMVIQSCVHSLGVQTIITSRIEHHAVLNTTQMMSDLHGVSLEYVDIDSKGEINIKSLEQLLCKDSSKKLVSLMHINNEIGNLYDLSVISDLCQNSEALFHSDAVQSIGHWEWDMQSNKLDFMTSSAHKFHGPKGIGFVYIRKKSNLKPLILGGSQERGMRAGTESIHNIVGLEQAIVEAYEHLEKERSYIRDIKSYFIAQLKKYFPNIIFNGCSDHPSKSTYNILNVCFADCSDEKALMLDFQLDMKGISCSKGSACQSGSNLESHVIRHILPDNLLKKPSLRFSLSHFNTKEEVDYVIKVLFDHING